MTVLVVWTDDDNGAWIKVDGLWGWRSRAWMDGGGGG